MTFYPFRRKFISALKNGVLIVWSIVCNLHISCNHANINIIAFLFVFICSLSALQIYYGKHLWKKGFIDTIHDCFFFLLCLKKHCRFFWFNFWLFLLLLSSEIWSLIHITHTTSCYYPHKMQRNQFNYKHRHLYKHCVYSINFAEYFEISPMEIIKPIVYI